MSINYGAYWKTYSDFKRKNYDFGQTVTLEEFPKLASMEGYHPTLNIYRNMERVQNSLDPYLSTSSKNMINSYSFCWADFWLATQSIIDKTANITNETPIIVTAITKDSVDPYKAIFTKASHGLTTTNVVKIVKPNGGIELYYVVIIDVNTFTLRKTTSFVAGTFKYLTYDECLALYNISNPTVTTFPITKIAVATKSNDATYLKYTMSANHNLTTGDYVCFDSYAESVGTIKNTLTGNIEQIGRYMGFIVEVINATSFYILSPFDGSRVLFADIVSANYPIKGIRANGYSANNIVDFNSKIILPVLASTIDITTLRMTYNFGIQDSQAVGSKKYYLTLYDFNIDSLNCIVNARGELLTKEFVY